MRLVVILSALTLALVVVLAAEPRLRAQEATPPAEEAVELPRAPPSSS